MKLKKLLLTSLSLFGLSIAQAQIIDIQFINNCPDPAVPDVDLYINGQLTFDNIHFREASQFTSVSILGTTHNIALAPATSTSINDTFFSINTTLIPTSKYLIVSNGMKNNVGFTPYKKFSLDIYSNAKNHAQNPSNIDVLFFHGCTDGTILDARLGIKTFADDVNYGQFSNGYTAFPAVDGKVRLTNTTGKVNLYNFSLAFNSLGLTSKAITVVSSGFINPAANNNGPAFGLYFATEAGGPLQPLPPTTAEAIARLQLIQNSADSAADFLDVYVGNDLFVDNLPFRNSTAFLDVIASIPSSVGIAPKNSTSVADVLHTAAIAFDSGANYVGVINGIISPSGYTPSPGINTILYKGGKEAASTPSNTDMLLVHGSTDAPSISITEGSNTIVTGLSYGNYNSAGYTSMATSNVIFDVKNSTNSSMLQQCTAPLMSGGLQGQATVIVASGFVTPSNNKNGPDFKLYATAPGGGPMILLPPLTGIENIDVNKRFAVVPNPAKNEIEISTREDLSKYTMTIFDISGRQLAIKDMLTGKKLDITALQPGTYFVNLQREGQAAANIKFVKE